MWLILPLTARTVNGPHPSRLTYLNWLERYLEEQGVKDCELWRALRDALLPYHHPRLYFLLKIYRFLIKRLESLVVHLGRQILPMPVRKWLWAKWENFRDRSRKAGN